VLAAVCYPTDEQVAGAVMIVGLQGIYSLSFLELWSLAQGGYSLRILMDWEATGRTPDWTGLQRIGAAKKANRLASLQRLSLLLTHQSNFSLSRRGRLVAAALAGVNRLIGQKQPAPETPSRAAEAV